MRAMVAVALAVAAAMSGAARAEEGSAAASDVRVGHWLEVRGSFDAGRRIFVGEKATLGEPERYEVLIGTLEAAGRSRYKLMESSVTLSAETRLRGGLRRNRLAGERVKVEGVWAGGRELEAQQVSPRGPGRERLAGRVDEVRVTESGTQVVIMGYPIEMPGEVGLTGKDLEQVRLAPEHHASEGSIGGRNEDDLFGRGLRLGERAAVLGQIRMSSTSEENFDLDRRDAEDRRDDDAGVRLRLEWRPSSRAILVGEGRVQERLRDDEGDGRSTREQLVLGETYALLLRPFGAGFDLQVGRQDFDDEREWVYDQNLDGLRAFFDVSGLRLEVAASTTLGQGRTRDRESINYSAYLARRRRDREDAVWVLHRDIDVLDERLTHFGVRSIGDRMWVDAAYLTGHRGGRRVAGWGFDVGSTFEPEWAGPLSFTLAWAFGSGGDDGGVGPDRTFRQTGFQDNNGKFGGVTSFRYYGELLDPELSNLGVLTAGIGARLARRTSLDLVGHYYRQDRPRDRMVDAGVDGKLTGLSRDLGWEIDLVFGDRRWESWDFEVVGAYFRPGSAFRDRDRATLAKTQARFRF